MNKTCTQEFLDLKNPLIIRSVLVNLDKSALILFLQQKGFSINSIKKMPKTKLIDMIIETFNLSVAGCNASKRDFYNSVLKQSPNSSYCLSNTGRVNPRSSFYLSSTDRILIQNLVNTSDIQKRRDILNRLDINTIYVLASYLGIPNAGNMNIEELRNTFIRLSSKARTPIAQRPQAQFVTPQQPQAQFVTPQQPQAQFVTPQQPQAYSYKDPPLVTAFLNARTIADRREMLKNLNIQQLFVLANYFKSPEYYNKNQTRENIIKNLLYNLPPPNVTSIQTDGVSLTQKVINGFKNAQTVSTRKEYLNTLDKNSLLLLAEHFDAPNNNREEIFNYLVYKVPSTPTVAPISSTCNNIIPKNVQFFSEKEKRIVKAFINATSAESKKKLLNSLSKEDLLILAQKFNIYGASSLNIAQLREQIFKNRISDMSLIQKFELAQTPEQRKEVFNFLDKRGLIMLAKKYNIANINKMSSEAIRDVLLKIPYLNYKSPSYNTCGIPSYTAFGGGTVGATPFGGGTVGATPFGGGTVGGSCEANTSPYVTTNKNLMISPSPSRTSSSIDVLKNLPPPMAPGDKILTPFRNKQKYNIAPSSYIQTQPVYASSECQTSLNRNLLPNAPSVPSISSIQRQSNLPQKIIEPVPTSFTRSPLRVSVKYQTLSSPQISSRSPPMVPPSAAAAKRLPTASPQIFSRSPPMVPTASPSVFVSPQTSNRSTCCSAHREIDNFVGPTEVSRNSSCNLTEPSVPTVVVSNVDSPGNSMEGLMNLLDNLYGVYGQDSSQIAKNKNEIRGKIKSYLEENPIYTDEGKEVFVDNFAFMSNGVTLLDERGGDKEKVEEVKRSIFNLSGLKWTTIGGIVGVGLVYLTSWAMQAAATTAAGFPINALDAKFPINTTDFGLPPINTTAGGFPMNTTAGGFPMTNTTGGFPMTNTDVGFPMTTTDGGFPTTTTNLGYPCVPGPYFDTAVGFPTTTDLGYACLPGPYFDTAVGFPTTTGVGFPG